MQGETTSSTMSKGHAHSEGMSDELAGLLPASWLPDLPLARIYTCGTLTVEVLTRLPSGNEQAVYGPPAALETKGISTALLLLTLLICQPERLASKDFLLQTLARPYKALDEEDDLQEDRAFKRLDNVVYLLRKLLSPPALNHMLGADKLRKHLVRYIRATSESGPSYQLAGWPLLWLDIEAMEAAQKLARRLQAHGEDGLQEWQQVYQIGMRGAFLVHEPYSGWTERMRAKVADLLWQSVQAQWKRALSREDGEQAALQLLLDFWQEHIMNEDAFRSLVELLGKQGRFQQAEDCYKQLCTALHQQGRIPSQRTQGTMDFIRTFQFQRERRDSRLVLASSTPQVIEGRVSHIDEKLHPQVLPETRHLIGREMWLSAVRRMVQTFPAKKLIVLRGPIGVGKSSELARLARSFQQEIEDLAIQAYTRWLDEGNMEMQEAGNVVTELAVLLLTRHRLLEVAELVVRCGWISFQLGHGPRLALLAQEVMGKIDWHKTVEDECAGLVLLEALFPFRGRAVETKEIINYERIYNAFLADTLVLQEATEGYIVHLFTLNLINALHFSEAKALLDMYRLHLEARSVKPENSEAWLQKRALLLGMWCEYLQETGDRDQSQTMRKETIRLYQQRAHLLSPKQSRSLLDKMLRIRALGSCFSFLGYHLNRIGEHQEALRIIEQAVALQEQGLANIGVLASSYSDKAQILMELGRFQEAVFFDEKAIVEIQRCIDAGDAGSQGDLGTYYVNRGRLYLRLGRVEEAEHLFRKAFPHIHEDRRKYRMFAQEGLNEIEQWREQSVTPEYQLDWRWVERYRELCAYDNIWWLTWAGPFTLEEQQEWDRLFTLPLNDEIKEQLGTLTNQQKKSSGLAHLLLALLLTLYHSHKHFALCTLSLRHYCSYDVYSDNLMLMKQLLGERKGYSLSCSTSMHDCWT